MTDLLAARSQMAMSLAFHIVFAVIGIAMPVMMVLAEQRWLGTGDPEYRTLARRWSRGTAILFAVGAVSGTVLSFELGLLWPGFMEWAGPIIGMPFSLEGFAFFTEAIFLGVYLYGWERIPPRAHVAAGWAVAASGAVSGVFVVIANAWMNAPRGFRVVDGRPVDIDPLAAMLTPTAAPQALHMTLAAYAAVGMLVAGLHAWRLLRAGASASRFDRHALAVALVVGAPAALLQPLSGDWSAQVVAETQPAKLAAMEAQFATERGAPLRIGGLPDEDARRVRWAIEIPHGLSLLAFHDPDAEVRGLDTVPREDWPAVTIVHLAFQVMVGLGTFMAAVGAWGLWLVWRRRDLAAERWFLRALAIGTPAGILAIEAGWVVTEVGRQPWIVQGVLRTADAVTPMPGLVVPFLGFTMLYLVLAVVVARVLWGMVREGRGRPTGEIAVMPPAALGAEQGGIIDSTAGVRP
jgi:cytochrome d ubiquinol oxidase subunit I